MTSENKPNMRAFLEAVGRRDFEESLGLKTQVVTRALAEGAMPPAWARGVREFCEARRVEHPEHLFKWRDIPDQTTAAE